jgi:integrase/recombinase XerD
MTTEKRAAVLTDAEFRRVLAVAKDRRHGKRNTALLYLSFAMGLRAKEIAMLRLRDVVDPQGTLRHEVLLTRENTKGGRQRLIYLANKDARRALADYLEARALAEQSMPNANAPLFRSGKGGPFSPNTMQMLFKRLYREAGIPDASSHSGRRTFATSLIEKGVDIKAVSTLMGHSSVGMTARYVEQNPVRLRRICEEVQLGLRTTRV